MNPGMPCIQCHASDEGPRFSIAGTVYPTIAEPDLCNGAASSSGAQVVITGADGRLLTLSPQWRGQLFLGNGGGHAVSREGRDGRGREGDDGRADVGRLQRLSYAGGRGRRPGRIVLP